jgi:VCBS repeat-containing protein
VGGQSYTDSIVVSTADGTAQTLTVSILGTNDAAVIAGSSSASLTESNAIQSTSGKLSATDVDSSAAFVAQSAVAGSQGHGKFSITADGSWTYVMDSAHDEFVGGQSYTDSIVVSTADGTAQTLTVSILGTNDAPTLSVAGTGLTQTLEWNDVDSPTPELLTSALAGWSLKTGSSQQWTQAGNFGVVELTMTGANTASLRYTLKADLDETAALAAAQKDFDRFVMVVEDEGGLVASAAAAFNVEGTQTPAQWKRTGTGGVDIFAMSDDQAVIRVNAMYADWDGQFSYTATFRDSGSLSQVEGIKLVASGNYLLGQADLSEFTRWDAPYFRLDVTANVDGTDVTRNLTALVNRVDGLQEVVYDPQVDASPVLRGSSASDAASTSLFPETQRATFLGGVGSDVFADLDGPFLFAGGGVYDSTTGSDTEMDVAVLADADLRAKTTDHLTVSMFTLGELQSKLDALPEDRYGNPDMSVSFISQEFVQALGLRVGTHQSSTLVSQADDLVALTVLPRAGRGALTDAESIVLTDLEGQVTSAMRLEATLDGSGQIDGSLALVLGDSADRIVSSGLGDRIHAGAGNDTVWTRGKGLTATTSELALKPRIYGDAGDDILAAGQRPGNDSTLLSEVFLEGGAGDDVLVAVAGTVYATGGSTGDVGDGGRDVFALYGGQQDVRLIIQDFNATTDLIDLSALLREAKAAIASGASPLSAQALQARVVSDLLSLTQGQTHQAPVELDLSAWLDNGKSIKVDIHFDPAGSTSLTGHNVVLEAPPPAWVLDSWPDSWHNDLKLLS